MRTRSWLGALVAATLLAAACGGDGDTTAAPGGGEDPTRVGMALPGPKNDKGFNQAHYDGLLLAEERFDIEIAVQENVADPQERIDSLKNLAADNELVIGVGAEFAEAGVTVAPQFPDVEFMIINGETSDAPNLHVYGVRQGVPAYVAGLVAAELTNTGKVGFVGGEEIPPTTQSDDGFRGGAEAGSHSIEYVSTILGDFNDPQKAQEATSAQIAAGADVIFGFIDAGFPGMVGAVEDSGKEVLLFDVIFPKCQDFPDILVGTAILNSLELVSSMVNDYLEGTIPDEPLFYGVEDPEIQRFELCPSFATEELTALVDETQQAIAAGETQLPEGV